MLSSQVGPKPTRDAKFPRTRTHKPSVWELRKFSGLPVNCSKNIYTSSILIFELAFLSVLLFFPQSCLSRIWNFSGTFLANIYTDRLAINSLWSTTSCLSIIYSKLFLKDNGSVYIAYHLLYRWGELRQAPPRRHSLCLLCSIKTGNCKI